MKILPKISAKRSAEVFKEMVSCRREYCADDQFPKMSDMWQWLCHEDEWLCHEDENWSIRTYRTNEMLDHKRKAGVIAFGDSVTLTVDQTLMANAKRGCKFANFALAHELGHLALDHHATSASTKNFQLFNGPSGRSNIPPTSEELEANYAAVFLQCGIALLDHRYESVQLALRAYSDVYYVKKARRLVNLEAFRRELAKLSGRKRRVVL